MKRPGARPDLLATVGGRVRALRERSGRSRRQLAEASGVSERFLAQLEAGEGNISLVRFAEVAAALDTTPSELLAETRPAGERAGAVALLGVRGAGKSSVGARLARRRRVPFVEVDQRIEQLAGLRLSEIFELHGEAYYRRLEREVLAPLLRSGKPAVLAVGGGIVTDPANWGLLRDHAFTVWLRARPEDHWQRVVAQGDARPMRANPQAFAELRALLAAREPAYGRADHVVDTSGRDIDAVVEAVEAAVTTRS